MRTFDISPLFRTTVGFDHMASLLDAALRMDDAAVSYPPYNIEKVGEDAYRITMAVAGFAREELTAELHENTLTVSAKRETENGGGSFLHRGIGARSFKRWFHLADHVKVVGAQLENGLLRIDLVRELPEEMKPRRIAITASAPKKIVAKAKKLIEDVKKAA